MFNWMDRARGTCRMAEVTGATGSADVCLADITAGFVAGTKVATMIGWRAVEAIAPGDLVLTFDGGLQPVREVRRHVIWGGGREHHRHWPLFVPSGALGNQSEMWLLPEQTVLVESDVAEDLTGDPFALIPARALEGFRGITASAPAARLEIVQLVFGTDEVAFANIGALFYCPADRDILAAIRAEVTAPGHGYQVLDFDRAEAVVTLMEMDEADPTLHAGAETRMALAS